MQGIAKKEKSTRNGWISQKEEEIHKSTLDNSKGEVIQVEIMNKEGEEEIE